MSGYRTVHRIVQPTESGDAGDSSLRPPLWRVRFSPCRTSGDSQQRVIASGSSDYIQCYSIKDRTSKDVESDSVLDASALSVEPTDRLVSNRHRQDDSKLSLGYAALDVARNYVGEDDLAGNEIIAASQLGGRVSIWVRLDPALVERGVTVADDLANLSLESDGINYVKPHAEFTVDAATGTTLAMRPPSLGNYYSKRENDVLVAVGCADGAVLLCKSGVQAARPGDSGTSGKAVVGDSSSTSGESISIRSGSEVGEVVATIGGGHAPVLSIAFHPSVPNAIAVGRKDGTVDIYSQSSSLDETYYRSGELAFRRMHRLTHSSHPVRALSFSQTDGALLFAGDDEGHLYSYDASCNSKRGDMGGPVKLVACALSAHKGWVMNLCAFPDGSRVATCGSDRSCRVWDAGMGLASSTPVHSFESVHDGLVWDVDCSRGHSSGFMDEKTSDRQKLITCGNDGCIQVCSAGE